MASSKSSSVTIVSTSVDHFEELYQVLDMVAREKRYLALFQAPAVEEAFAFFHKIVEHDLCQLLALEDGAVVGWCDILPKSGQACAHVGTLGIGLRPSARHRGIGSLLLAATIARAWAKGLSRIELSVRVDNINAKALYERFGFIVEGVNRQDFCVDGAFFDSYSMALRCCTDGKATA